MKTFKVMLILFLLSFQAFAHDGQDGNGPVMNISLAEREACLILKMDTSDSEFIQISKDGEDFFFYKDELKPKCCALSPDMSCLSQKK